MNLESLREVVRSRADDKIAPNLWSDDEIKLFLNEAVSEAAVRAKLIYDEDSSICRIPVVYGKAVYTLHPSIYEIVGAWLVKDNDQNNARLLFGVSQSLLDSSNVFHRRTDFNSYYRYFGNSFPYWLGTNWRNQTGEPRYYIQDQARIQLVPKPIQVTGSTPESIKLGVFRTPTEDEEMECDDDKPVIPAHWHQRLVDWALFRMYSKKDAETYDPNRAALAQAAFEDSFGKRVDANVVRKRNQRTRRTVACAFP